jgi:hypothetical protein
MSDKKQRIIRSKSDSDYFQMRNNTAQDETLPYDALGVLTYLLSKPADWETTVFDLRKRGDGKAKIYRILSDLEQAGYMKKPTKYQDRATGKWVWTPRIVADKPRFSNPCPTKPDTGGPDTGNKEIKEQRTDNKEQITKTDLSPPETGDDSTPVLESAIIATLKAIHETNGQCAANPDVYAECKNRELIVNGELTPGAYDLIGVDDSTPPLDDDSDHDEFKCNNCFNDCSEYEDGRITLQDGRTYCKGCWSSKHVRDIAFAEANDNNVHGETFCDDCGGLLTGGEPDNTYIHCICDNGRAQYVKQDCGCVWYMVDGKHDETRSTYCDEHASAINHPLLDFDSKLTHEEIQHAANLAAELESDEQLTAEQAAVLLDMFKGETRRL